jgi:hypothetical protein
MRGVNPNLRNNQIIEIIRSTATPLGIPNSGNGRLNAERAVHRAACLVDADNNSNLNANDFMVMLNQFNYGSSLSDMNSDGNINAADFMSFLNAYAEGCTTP